MLLWFVVAVLLIRGAADVLERSDAAVAGGTSSARAAAWPDDEARAFAVDFARAYLSYSPTNPERYADAVRAFVAPEIADAVVPEFGKKAPRGTVSAATVARTVVLDARHALVTVSAESGRYLTVPVARDAAGGLVVYDLPSFAVPPARAEGAPTSAEALSGAEQEEIRDVLERFLAAYLAGDAQALAYFVPAGESIGALGRPHDLVRLTSVAQTAPGVGRSREVLVTVRARDAASDAVYALRYRLRLVRMDRWLVSEVNNATRKEG